MERRKEKRMALDPVDLITAEFYVAKESKKGKLWILNVNDCSNYGLGLLISKAEAELLKILNPDDVIADMMLYSQWGIIKVDATIKHITKIKHGKYKDQHILGVNSDEIIEICRPA